MAEEAVSHRCAITMSSKTIFITWMVFMVLAVRASAEEIHVSPSGDDSNPGTSVKPLASLAAARQRARQFAGKEPVKVLLYSGVYYLPDTLIFAGADSGTEKNPVIYAAA